MDSLDECFLHFGAVLNVLDCCDKIALGLLSQTCKILQEECSQEHFWHKLYGPVLSSVPPTAKKWKERLRLRKVYKDISEILAQLESFQVEAPRETFILPPGKHQIPPKILQMTSIEGYLPNEYNYRVPEETPTHKAKSEHQSPSSEPKPEDQNVNMAPEIVSLIGDRPILQVRLDTYGEVSLKNLAFVGDAAGVWNHRGELIIDNCVFASGYYGVISYGTGRSRVSNSTFHTLTKPACYTHDTGTLEMINCSWFKCYSAVSLYSTTKVTLKDSKVVETGHAGSAAVLLSGGCELEVDNTIFERCIGLGALWAQRSNDDKQVIDGSLHVANSTFIDNPMTGLLIHGIKTKVEKCIFNRNNVGIDSAFMPFRGNFGGLADFQFAGVSAVVVGYCATDKDRQSTISECEIRDHKSDAIFIHQGADVVLTANKVIDNKCKGICIDSTCPRVLSDNIVAGNLGGDLDLQPYDPEAAFADEVTISKAILDVINTQKCTYTLTGPHYMVQQWYYCRTCNLVDTEGVCEVCKDTCHKGHDIDYKHVRLGVFYCDCGASLNCKSKS